VVGEGSAVASKQDDILRGGGRAHPSSDDSAAADAKAEAEHTHGHAWT
jgi:hypothetical protein